MKYFVSYKTSDGFGRCSVTRDKPILDISDIKGIEDGLRRSNGENQIAILNWREFHSNSQPQENLADSSQAVQQTHDAIASACEEWQKVGTGNFNIKTFVDVMGNLVKISQQHHA